MEWPPTLQEMLTAKNTIDGYHQEHHLNKPKAHILPVTQWLLTSQGMTAAIPFGQQKATGHIMTVMTQFPSGESNLNF